ncbi:hypothetical protein [Clostridium tyrobutyricum]|uniref:hypothetical protein n=1 Tax=Clostridium tyrobutyricum TaxID=1519 RepID=UPI00057F2263|nr:hypothetical protein [Clostridium tyrobutyricum]QCH28095.1 hypothetical protein EZN00_01696 [Clostridium tyrobutyricum]
MGRYENEDMVKQKLSQENFAKIISELNIANAQKDLLIQQLSGTVKDLNIKVAQLQGGSTNV